MAEFPVNIRGNRVTPQRLSLRVGDTSAVLDVKFQLASVGQQLPEYQGEWQSTSSYNSGDVVLYNGSTYQSNQSVSSGGSAPETSASWDLYGYVTAQIDRWFEDTYQIIAAGLSMEITSVSPVLRARLAIDHTSYLPDEDTFAIHFRVHEDGDMNRYPDRDALFVDADPEGGDGYTDDELNNLFVPLSREVNAGTGLTGGGNLSQDRVLSLNADLGQLNDTSISPSDDDILVYEGGAGEWVSQELTADLITGGGQGVFFGEDSIEAGQYLSKTYNSSTDTLRLDVDDLDTDDITEASNKYYTDERVDDRVATLVQGGENTTVTYDDTSGELLIETAGGGGTGTLDLGEYSLVYDDTNDELEFLYSDGSPVLRVDSVGNVYARRDVIAYASGSDDSTDTVNSRLGVFNEGGQLLTQDAKQIEFTGGVTVTEPNPDEIVVDVSGTLDEDSVFDLLTGGTGINISYDGSLITIDGVAQYTDSDAISAINNDSDHGSTAPHNYFTDSDAVDAYNSYLGNYKLVFDDTNDELEVLYSDGSPVFRVDSDGNIYARRDVIAFSLASDGTSDPVNSRLGVLDESGQLLTQDAKQVEFTGGVTVTEPNPDEILVDVGGKTTEEVQDNVAALLSGGTGISLNYNDTNDTLTIDGVAQYEDADAIAAINNDSDHGSTASHNYFSGDHADLTGIGSSDHHARYTDSEAISAINNDADHGSTAQHNYYTDSDAVDAYNTYLGNYQFAYDGTNDELEVQYQDGTPLFWVDDAGNVYAKSDVVAFASGPGGGGTTTNSRLGVLDETGQLLTDDAKQIEFSGGVTVTEPNADEIVVDVAGVYGDSDVADLLVGGTGISLNYDGTSLTIDGVAQYTDADAISAINNDGDHGATAQHNYFSGDHADLSGIGSSDHHTRYSDSEARSALEGSTPSFGNKIGMGNDGDVINYLDSNNQSSVYWGGEDGIEFRGDGSVYNMVVRSGNFEATNDAVINGNLYAGGYRFESFPSLGGSGGSGGVYNSSYRAYIGLIRLTDANDKEWIVGEVSGARTSFDNGGSVRFYAENDPYNDGLDESGTSAYVRSEEGNGAARLVEFEANGYTWVGIEYYAGGSGMSQDVKIKYRTISDSGADSSYPAVFGPSEVSNERQYSGSPAQVTEEFGTKDLHGRLRVKDSAEVDNTLTVGGTITANSNIRVNNGGIIGISGGPEIEFESNGIEVQGVERLAFGDQSGSVDGLDMSNKRIGNVGSMDMNGTIDLQSSGDLNSVNNLNVSSINSNNGDNAISWEQPVKFRMYGGVAEPAPILLQPDTSGGQTAIRFQSNVNPGSDFGEIRWHARYGTSGSDESSLLEIRTENDDPGGGIGDNIALRPAADLHLDPQASDGVVAVESYMSINRTDPETALHVQDDGVVSYAADLTASGNDQSTDWNQAAQLKLEGGNNSLAFSVPTNTNHRKSVIQSGHASTGYSNFVGEILLNPLGGNVGVNKTSTNHTLDVNGRTRSTEVEVTDTLILPVKS